MSRCLGGSRRRDPMAVLRADPPPPVCWRLHDIVLLRGLWARINPLLIAPLPTRIAHTIALLLHDYCTLYDSLRPPLCMPHTIQCWSWQYLVKANLCASIRKWASRVNRKGDCCEPERRFVVPTAAPPMPPCRRRRTPKPSPGVYFWDLPPVFHLYPACISPYLRYSAVSLYLAILQQIHRIPLYPTVSSSIRTYLAVSSCI